MSAVSSVRWEQLGQCFLDASGGGDQEEEVEMRVLSAPPSAYAGRVLFSSLPQKSVNPLSVCMFMDVCMYECLKVMVFMYGCVYMYGCVFDVCLYSMCGCVNDGTLL